MIRRKGSISNRPKRIATLTAAAFAALVLAAPASALAAPVLKVTSSHSPHAVPVGTYVQYTLTVSNTGNATTSGPITVGFTAPAGLEVIKASAAKVSGFDSWACSTPDSQTASCVGPTAGLGLEPGPGQQACVFVGGCRIAVFAKVDSGLQPDEHLTPTIEACGGGAAACASASDPLDLAPLDFRVTSFDGAVLKSNGTPATQAGSHPATAFTDFFFSTRLAASGLEVSTQDLQDAVVELPPGVVGNPQAADTCTQAQLSTEGGFACPPESQVGVVTVWFNGIFGSPGSPRPEALNLYNMETPQGTPGLLAFSAGGAPIEVYFRVRTGGDYGVTVINKNAPQTLPIAGVTFTVWGVPADPSHNGERGKCINAGGSCPSSASLKPFFTLPTSCVGPVRTFLDVTSWQEGSAGSSFLSHDNTVPIPNPIGADGCNAVDFSPSLEARPTTNVADSPSGLDVDLHIPQNENPTGTAEAHLEDTTVTLPEGLVVNPSGANGLDGCSSAEIGLTSAPGVTPITTTAGPASCPDAAKLGTVEVDSPLLDHPIKGAVYIAKPFDNPFDSLLAIYIAIDDSQTGVVVKLAGKVTPDPITGQLSATFSENPQLPFEDFKLHFFGGSGGSLRTPAVCGTYTTTSSLTPWTAPDSGAPKTPSDTWAITQGPGGACASSDAARPNAPSFDAGTVSPIAGAYSPFVVHLRRADGSQNFAAVNVTPPQGLIGKLAGVAICSDATLAGAAAKTGRGEEANPSCPAASRVGTVVAGAGAGPAPYYASGKAYLTGPYKGAPISLAIVTPAVAGPFDLGTIVIRTALYVDPKTAQISAVSDPIPSILEGIPLDVRTVDISLDRPQFTSNPTSCDPSAVSGMLTSTQGQTASLFSRFQVGECGQLGFKPKMSLRLKGGTTRGKHPALTAVLEPRAGDANLANISVALPHSEFLDQAHIGTVCTRVQFAADQCPAASIYGTATVSTPLLDYPVTGNVYLRSSDNELPDLVPDFRGPAYQPIKLEADGRTDSIKGGIRNTFDFVPDAPFSKLVLSLQGGNKGLLQNSTNICKTTFRATVKYGAHNGLTLEAHPALAANCPKKRKNTTNAITAETRSAR